VEFNSKFNNTSKAETGNVATPSKSGSFYTTLSHIHTHTKPTKEMVAHYERVITHYLYSYTKLCKMHWAYLPLLENSYWCFCNMHPGGNFHGVWDTSHPRVLPFVNDQRTERNSFHTIKPTCAVLYFQSCTSVMKVGIFLFATTVMPILKVYKNQPNGAGKCS
jgi:hypothetical protein